MASTKLTRILMVEDDPDIQTIAGLALESLGGFQVHVCSSGDQAIHVAPTFQPDLILLDVMMPGMDGPSTLSRLRAMPALQATPVIFITAKMHPQEFKQYIAMGVLDVIAKPFDPMALSSTIASIWSRHQPTALQAELQSFSEAYLAQLPERIATLEATWQTACEQWSVESLVTVRRLTHNIHGAGATFGHTTVSNVARTLEQCILVLDPELPLAAHQRTHIDNLIETLKQAAGEPPLSALFLAMHAQDVATADRIGEASFLPRSAETPKRVAYASSAAAPEIGQTPADASPARAAYDAENRLIFLATIDAELSRDLAEQLEHFGYAVHVFGTLPALVADHGAAVPAAIIIGAAMLGMLLDSDLSLADIRAAYDILPPCIVVSDQDDIISRLRAARAGAEAYFIRPVNIITLIDKLDALTVRYEPEPYRILIVDDEPELAHYYAATLRQAGMATEVVTEPMQVMRPLVDFRPDMILMDMYMPDCDGLDLAAVIRQREEYVSIPIVFLSAETNLDMQLEALRLGGDDFMTKPIKPDHLILAVTTRVLRSRTLRAFMVRDSLTALFNHTTTKEHLEIELARAKRNQSPLAFAIIDIDRFKSVNDTYGHPIGDRVLKSLSRLLRQRLRKTDVIGRYGGEEFAVVLVDTNGPDALAVLDQIRVDLAHIRHQAAGGEFTVTFSCGIACFADYTDTPKLTEAADRALYEAKHSGRNRVIMASAPAEARVRGEQRVKG